MSSAAPELLFRQTLFSQMHLGAKTCPWCEQEIPPEKLQEISGKIVARERAQVQAITEKLHQRYAIEKAEADAKAKADLELERQRGAAREAAAREEARKAAEAAAAKKLAEAHAQSTDAEAKLAKLQEQYECVLKERLDSQREILEKAREDAINAERARGFEETQKLSNKVAELQRALENKTAEELGEGAEVNLFEALKREFPNDRIERIARGTPGADIHHAVLLHGRECGTVIYDSKNHKAFRNDHVEKLAEDQIAARADHAILSTHKFPQGTRQLHVQGGVLLANPARVLAVVTLIRQHLVQIHTLRLSGAERQNKTASLYAFITSERCTQLFGRIDAQTDELLEHQLREKKWHEHAWRKQGEAIRSIQKVKAELSTEISCIIGTAPDEALRLEKPDP
jgi:hypothetical protein